MLARLCGVAFYYVLCLSLEWSLGRTFNCLADKLILLEDANHSLYFYNYFIKLFDLLETILRVQF